MARPSYGPEAKKRSTQLFTALFDYANDELDGDEAALDALRPHIQTHWQCERRLVVRTKVRFLEALSKLSADSPLSGEQVKEALRRFEDFLEILEDNRPNRGGSEIWHFTLNLWHKRSDRTANLRRFEAEWEQRRPQKSKQVTRGIEETRGRGDAGTRGELHSGIQGGSLTPGLRADAGLSPRLPFSASPRLSVGEEREFQEHRWWQWCRDSLEAQQYQRLTTNPLTAMDGMTFDLHELYVPLGLVERRQQDRREVESPDKGSRYEEESEVQAIAVEQFLKRLLQSEVQQRIAIVGEPGAGKTTLLQKIAIWLLDYQALPIWISLADLQGATLEQYLLQDWLEQATRKVSVDLELQEALAAQFRQGRVWLLLDAIDEMATDASTALAAIARQLRGWIADAHVVLTCRLNVWDGSKNALDTFTTYRNSSFSYGDAATSDQVGQFVKSWFRHQSGLGDRLRIELDKPERKRIKDAVKNPLRLALLCRSWSLTQGTLPSTKATLYQQFVETIYEWKQDRFPTTPAQRQQLNQMLGELALRALAQPDTRFRLSYAFVQQLFGAVELLPLALQLGWLNQVGISAKSGEKMYAFYHPTFQEYFAARAISDGQFFLDPTHDFPVFSSHWREVILLWLGRTDVSTADKESLIQVLMEFEDGCGGFYSYRACFLAAAGLAEFPQYSKAEVILTQLLDWRFGATSLPRRTYPTPLCEGARVALLQTDRTLAAAALERFIPLTADPFACWKAAYTLGKTLEPGHPQAIAALTKLIHTIRSETLRLQICDSLGKVAPGNAFAVRTLVEIMESTQGATRRKAAYSLGKIDPGNSQAIATLEDMITSAADAPLRLQAAENLVTLAPTHPIAIAVLEACRKGSVQPSRKRQLKSAIQATGRTIAMLEQRLLVTETAADRRRIAYRLATLQPGHPQAIDSLLHLLLSPRSPVLYKRVVENLKEVLLDNQLVEIVPRLKEQVTLDRHGRVTALMEVQSTQAHECYKLLWHCAQRMTYNDFHRTMCGTQ